MQTITEADQDVIKEWYEVRPRDSSELAAFVKKLTTEYQHDYGTICHAAAAAAVAAARTVDASPQGGLSGFQAGAVMWEFIKSFMGKDSPMRLVDYADMLFPHSEKKFTRLEISSGTMQWLQAKAKKMLAEHVAGGPPDKPASPDPLLVHLEKLADGQAPFGFTVRE